MEELPYSPDILARVIIERFGGKDRFFHIQETRHRALLQAWQQDADMIGRVVRSHLFVEYHLTDFLQVRTQGLITLDAARLTFAQKLGLVPEDHPTVGTLTPGIKRLNVVRNRIAHTLRADLLEEDSNVFRGVGIFAAMKRAGGQAEILSASPIAILESFAYFAGSMFAAAADPDAELWSASITEEELRDAKAG